VDFLENGLSFAIPDTRLAIFSTLLDELVLRCARYNREGEVLGAVGGAGLARTVPKPASTERVDECKPWTLTYNNQSEG
jgi:hypothetical protein